MLRFTKVTGLALILGATLAGAAFAQSSDNGSMSNCQSSGSMSNGSSDSNPPH